MANPIVKRELHGLLRRPQTLMTFTLLVAALSAAIVAMWPDDAAVSLFGNQSQQLFRVFVYGLLVCLLLAVPAFPATAIVNERNSGTLGLLLTSPLTPMQILVGKISAVVGFVLLLLILSLPAVMACFVMGGIDIGQILLAYAILGVAAIQYAMIGLLVSSYARGGDSALRVTYGLTLMLAIVTLGPYRLLEGGMFAEPLLWIYCLSPIPAITGVLGQGDVGSLGFITESQTLINRYLLLAVASIVLCIVWLRLRLQPTLLDRSRAAGKVTDERTRNVQRFRRIMYLWFFDPQRRSKAIGDHTNPVMIKELRTRALGRGHWMMRLIGACLIVSLALMLMAARWTAAKPEQIGYLGGALVIFQMALVLLITPALSSGLIAVEVESRGWQLLQVTRLSPLSIVIGKLLSVVMTVVLLLLATIPGYAVLLVIDAGYTDRVIGVLISLVLTAAFALMLGAACSSIVKRTAVSTTLAYLLIVVLCVGTLVPWLGEGTLFGRSLVESVLMVNPVAAALSTIRMPGFADYNIAQANWRILGVAAAVFVLILWFRAWWMSRPE